MWNRCYRTVQQRRVLPFGSVFYRVRRPWLVQGSGNWKGFQLAIGCCKFCRMELTLWKDGAGLGSAWYVAKPDVESPNYAAVAQYLVEHMVEAHGVGSSSLPGGTT